MGNAKSRNALVERIRVLACMLVIWNHIQIILPVNNGEYYTGQALIYSIIRCNVPLFLIISGYFCFRIRMEEKCWQIFILINCKIFL